jgi:ribosome-associated heat shock protein Hsp15
MADETRIDRWLCAVRLVKTRPMATQLCEGGHVRVKGNPAKASTKVRAGDVVHALIAQRERIVEVVQPIETRVGATVASRPPATSTTARRRSSARSRQASRPSAARAGRASASAASWNGCGGRHAADRKTSALLSASRVRALRTSIQLF